MKSKSIALLFSLSCVESRRLLPVTFRTRSQAHYHWPKRFQKSFDLRGGSDRSYDEETYKRRNNNNRYYKNEEPYQYEADDEYYGTPQHEQQQYPEDDRYYDREYNDRTLEGPSVSHTHVEGGDYDSCRSPFECCSSHQKKICYTYSRQVVRQNPSKTCPNSFKMEIARLAFPYWLLVPCSPFSVSVCFSTSPSFVLAIFSLWLVYQSPLAQDGRQDISFNQRSQERPDAWR